MKKLMIVVPAMLLAALLLAACQEQEQSVSVAVVSTDEVYMGSQAGQVAGDILNKMSERLRDGIMELQTAAMNTPEGEEAAIDFEGAIQGFQLALQEEQQRMIMAIDEEFQKILDEMKAEMGYSIILEAGNVLSFDEANDITEEVLARLDAANLDLDEAAALQTAEEVIAEFIPQGAADAVAEPQDEAVEEEAIAPEGGDEAVEPAADDAQPEVDNAQPEGEDAQ